MCDAKYTMNILQALKDVFADGGNLHINKLSLASSADSSEVHCKSVKPINQVDRLVLESLNQVD
jgi:hypothetical protein